MVYTVSQDFLAQQEKRAAKESLAFQDLLDQ